MTHTPGPWEVKEVGYGAHVGDVAWAGFGTARSKEEHQANARLMAAAPELLDALRIIQTWASCDKLSGETREQAMRGIENKCKAAIASTALTESKGDLKPC